MNAKKFSDLLTSLKACTEAKEWAEGKSLQSVWKTCKRGDWLLWLCERMADKPGWHTRKDVVLAACDCAETALKYVKEGEDRPRKCIETVRAWVAGTATLDDVIAARHAASAASASAASAASAYIASASAAYTSADAAASVAYAAAYVAYAAADAAAYADAYAAADAASAAAYAAYKRCAAIVRKRIPLRGLLDSAAEVTR